MASASDIPRLLQDTLSPDGNTRIAAELKLAGLMAHPEAGLAFAELSLSQNTDMNMRQSASIMLRKYVTERWSPYFPAFKGNAPSPEIKTRVRDQVFQGLSDPNRKIRSSSAHTLSTIASCDWPDEYPDLLTALIGQISSDSPNAVHGSMEVFAEFIKSDLTEDQILPVLRQLLPVLLNILGDTEKHSPLTRARTISVFRQCITSLYMVKGEHRDAVNEATATVLPVWLDAFKVLLNMDPLLDVNSASWDTLLIKVEIFKTLDNICTSFPKALTAYLQDYLNASLLILQSLYPTYEHYYITASATPPTSSEEENVELSHLLVSIFDFLSKVVMSNKAKAWLQSGNVQTLVASIFQYAQMTAEDEETWANNANAFVSQDEDDVQAYGMRFSAFSLLYSLIERAAAPVCATFQSTLHQVVQSSQTAHEHGVSSWWKSLEAAFAAIGSQSEDVIDTIEDEEMSERTKPIDIQELLSNVVPSLLNQSDVPFLQGRAFVFASQFAKLLPMQMAGQYLEAAVQVIESDTAGIPVKVSAVKAIHNFCQNADDEALKPLVPRIAQDLGPFLLVATEDTLSLVLETMAVVLEVDQAKWLTTDLATSLVLATLEVWAKNNRDPIFLSIFADILTALASSHSPGIYETVVQQALPSLCTSIASAKPEESWVAGSALDLISSLEHGAPENGLGEGFFALLAPNLFTCLQNTEDRDVLQNGTVCLTLVIRKDCNQLLSWKDTSSGQSGLDHVFKLVAKLLQSEDESGGLVIGDMLIHLLRRAGESVLPVLPDLLQAMASRMATAKTATFLQSLIIPFAFLVHNQADTVLGLLESKNTSDGRRCLDVVMQTWCENAETFQGFWPTRISTLALSQLYASGRPSLQGLMVKGDIIVKPETSNVIMTRSKTKTNPVEFTSIPFPVKALKLLVRELQSGGDSATIPKGEMFEVDSDDGDDDWAEEGAGLTVDERDLLSNMLGPHGANFDSDNFLADNDDEDLKNDPVSQMDMQAHIVSFLKECTANNANNFRQNVDQLSAEEIVVVRQAVQH
ncbi:ARM repeat-containing protein [Coniophora puteana RWD-64-598 SS2]|uniref:ARM repeat-containing protein n=1 Tax=Coniophora puteana (strain RWD-64-598) TaxID=741705 RepID=A0A5M3N803_CONPW|nr:ARM repeat-containing protein [Coniophora puteana RWD-64-598 SS2]EIW87234.1 ARM repeat-containing protein [Coniophora puteana RWD-64-598 SS2]